MDAGTHYPTKENGPGGNRSRSSNQKGHHLMHIIAHPTDIHPEIPLAPWATRRIEDTDTWIEDDYTTEIDGFGVSLGQVHVIHDDGTVFSSELGLSITWEQEWAGEDATHGEGFTCSMSTLPALIKALEAAQAVMTK